MKIAVSSQNFRNVSGQAGNSRRFVIFEVRTPDESPNVVWLDLPMGMALQGYSGGPHPLDEMDVILTASASEGLIAKLAQRGVKVVTCGEDDPRKAVRDYLNGTVRRANPYADLEQERHGYPSMACCCAA